MTLADRFWAKVQKADWDGCWLWTASLGSNGYGQFHMRLPAGWRPVGAHRVARFLADGKWPTLYICHRCDNLRCVRPDHLFEGTHSDNMLDMVAKGRSPAQNRPRDQCARGHLLAPENVRTWVAKSEGGRPKRCCRICQNDSSRALKEQKRRALGVPQRRRAES